MRLFPKIYRLIWFKSIFYSYSAEQGYNNTEMQKKNLSDPTVMAKIVLDRLERISADSPWAHQASGVRASLARSLSRGESGEEQLAPLLELGFLILEKAAGEIPE
jgi:hypothetical protein